ncbi:amidohydrolase family protein [Gordonia sp. CPCC 205515]|uniref:amidohydrolase n=1 Tax=Gordonia sp. CPCC 205515 TaxID=3140791 RepID=UPI003AF39FFE
MTAERTPRVAFVGGQVWTDGFSSSRALDVLIGGGQILDVARRGELDTGGAEVHDISGKLLTPGFQDAHIHPATGGLDLLSCDLSGLQTPDEVYAAIRDYAASHPDQPAITGGGWNRDVFGVAGPSRFTLDTLVGDRPAFLSPADRHGAWVNSAAMAAAGVSDSTPDPDAGSFTRDGRGVLTGMIEEGALSVVKAAIPRRSDAELVAAALAAQDHLLGFGVTSVQDAIVGTGLGMDDMLPAYRKLLVDDDFRLRLTAALWWDPGRGVEQIADLVERRRVLESVAGPERVIADMVKIMVDATGVVFLGEDELRDATVALDAAGFNVHYHSYGDATTHRVLNAVETAIAGNPPRKRRHQIAHLMVIAEDDFARFARLGVTANVQVFWGDIPVHPVMIAHATMTEDPHRREYAFARLQAAGARLAAGSDWPVTTADPLAAARSSVRRPSRGESKSVDELDRLDLQAVFGAYTVGSAFVNGRADTTGRIARGFVADVAVFDRDVFQGDEALNNAVVDEVWIGGLRVTHPPTAGAEQGLAGG